MKIVFGMIVFNSDFVLKQCLESVYPYASQILVAEGPVKYWQERGFTTSTDRTNDILHSFPDPYNKIKITHGQYAEKDEQCQSYMKFLQDDNDYMWNLDADEVYKQSDLNKLVSLLEEGRYTSVGFRFRSFFGGFKHYLTGFEEKHQAYRVLKLYPGSQWARHRNPPKLKHAEGVEVWPEKHLDYTTTAALGMRIYHYSYVFPRQVFEKVSYYKAAVSKDNCIDNYFKKIYLPWVQGDDEKRARIENRFDGVHEFVQSYRGSCRTREFKDIHPLAIQRDLPLLQEEFNRQLKELSHGN